MELLEEKNKDNIYLGLTRHRVNEQLIQKKENDLLIDIDIDNNYKISEDEISATSSRTGSKISPLFSQAWPLSQSIGEENKKRSPRIRIGTDSGLKFFQTQTSIQHFGR